MNSELWSEIIRLGTVAGVVWSASWFLFRQNITTRSLIYDKFNEVKSVLLDKLEYHERHDDTRFDNLRKDLIAIRLQQAAMTGKVNGKE